MKEENGGRRSGMKDRSACFLSGDTGPRGAMERFRPCLKIAKPELAEEIMAKIPRARRGKLEKICIFPPENERNFAKWRLRGKTYCIFVSSTV